MDWEKERSLSKGAAPKSTISLEGDTNRGSFHCKGCRARKEAAKDCTRRDSCNELFFLANGNTSEAHSKAQGAAMEKEKGMNTRG